MVDLSFTVKKPCGLHPGILPGWGGSVQYRNGVWKSDCRRDSSVHYRDEGGIRTAGGC
jgi:hypothetical protein